MPPRTPTKKEGAKPDLSHNNTVKRSKVRGTVEFLKFHDLLGRGKGQVTTTDVFDFYQISKTQGWSMLKSRLEDKNLTLRPPDFKDTNKKRKREESPDCRTLRNDYRFIDARGGNRKKDGPWADRPGGTSKSLSVQEVEQADKWLHDCADLGTVGTLLDLFRKPWTQIVAETGLQTAAAEQTLATHFMATGWYNCREQVKEAHNHRHLETRFVFAKKENELGRWNDPRWTDNVYSVSEWHFHLPDKNGQEHAQTVEIIEHEQPVVAESSAATAAIVGQQDYEEIAQALYREMDLQAAAAASQHNQHFSNLTQFPPPAQAATPLSSVSNPISVITIDPPTTAPRKPRGPNVFVKQPDAAQKVAHALVVVGADGYKSRLYWYDQPTNDVGKLNSDLYKVLYETAFADIRAHRLSRGLDPNAWTLWEDDDPTHTSKAVLAWKETKGYQCFQNAHWSPETNPVEDPSIAWLTFLSVSKSGARDVYELRRAAMDAWARVREDNVRAVFRDIARRLEAIEQECRENMSNEAVEQGQTDEPATTRQDDQLGNIEPGSEQSTAINTSAAVAVAAPTVTLSRTPMQENSSSTIQVQQPPTAIMQSEMDQMRQQLERMQGDIARMGGGSNENG